MLAYALHLLAAETGLTKVEIHPDGEHGKRFEIGNWLSLRGFTLLSREGSTNYCGTYERNGQIVLVSSIPGQGDVVTHTSRGTTLAECKGGVINTRHSGQRSRLRRGLCEAIGLLMARPKSGRQVAVVPDTETTRALALRLAPRASEAGIDIALVNGMGQVSYQVSNPVRQS